MQRFREIQQVYMPGFDPKNSAHFERLAASNATTAVHVEDCKLYMPSELSDSNRRKYCPAGLASMEDRLRYAEASDSLEDPRHHLRTRSFTNRFKIANVTGQIHNTRVRETQHRIDNKVRVAESKYKRARSALLKLRGKGTWEDTLQVLEQSDVRALNERELTAQEKEDIRRVRERGGVVVELDDANAERLVTSVAVVGEGQRRPSWIWFTGVLHEDLDDPLTHAGEYNVIFWLALYALMVFIIALRVEWAKAKARADRWEEEVVLLDEEMRRVLEFCVWKATWWLRQIPRRKSLAQPLAEGLRAYAEEHADLEHRIAASWEAKWASARQLAEPILREFWGVEPAVACQEDVEGQPIIIELDIDEDQGEHGNGADSDFEE